MRRRRPCDGRAQRSGGPGPAHRGIRREATKGMIVAVNKWDLKEDTGGRARWHSRSECLRRLRFTPWAPLAFVSAKEGLNIEGLLELALEIGETRSIRIPTAEVNSVLREAVAAHPPSSPGRRQMRIKYATQADQPADVRVLYQRREPDTLLLPALPGERSAPAVRVRGNGDKAGVSEQKRMNRPGELGSSSSSASYLIGAIPVGYIAARDPKEASTSVSTAVASSARRTCCARWAAARSFWCSIADALKGYIPTLVTWYIFQSEG